MNASNDRPPDSSRPSGVCPRCGNMSNFSYEGSIAIAYDPKLVAAERDGSRSRLPVERVSAFECLGCHSGVAVVEELYVDDRHWTKRGGGRHNWRGVMWWPAPAVAGLTTEVPASIMECFKEGLRCLGAAAPRGAAVMFRRTLEAIVHDRGGANAIAALAGPNGKLYKALEVMASEHKITPDLAEWAKELRLAGNAGGHYDPMDDVTTEEAESLSKLLRHLLVYLYEVAGQIRRARTP